MKENFTEEQNSYITLLGQVVNKYFETIVFEGNSPEHWVTYKSNLQDKIQDKLDDKLVESFWVTLSTSVDEAAKGCFEGSVYTKFLNNNFVHCTEFNVSGETIG